MIREILFFSLFGYLCGSILFAKVYEKAFKADDITINSRDHNPGTANAFKNGGQAYGWFTLIGDIFKGFLPVFLYCQMASYPFNNIGISLVMASPVLGHAFPIFNQFKGGKGIATSFGVLLGILPVWQPLILLALLFLVFSGVLIIKSTYYRTMVTYVLFMIICMVLPGQPNAFFGAICISFIVCTKLILSPEEKGAFTMEPVWKH